MIADQDPVTAASVERTVLALRAMAHPHRLHILISLQDGAQTPADLAHGMGSRPTSLTSHLRVLKDARLIDRKRRAGRIIYVLRTEAIQRIAAELLQFTEVRR